MSPDIVQSGTQKINNKVDVFLTIKSIYLSVCLGINNNASRVHVRVFLRQLLARKSFCRLLISILLILAFFGKDLDEDCLENCSEMFDLSQ